MPTSHLASHLASRLSPLDLFIVALYLVGITLFGLRFSARSKSSAGAPDKSLKNYFLANNTIPWWAIALSIVSAETSTLTIISVPGVAFGGDFGFLQIVLGYMLGRIVVALLFLPRYFRGEMLTAYQLIDQRFGPTLHKLTAGLFLLTRAAAEGVRVFAISIVVGIAIGTGDTLSIAIISTLTLLYTFEGGMAAVIWTDVVQMALYILGTFAALWTLGAHIPGGWRHIHAVAAPLGKFNVLHFALNLTQTYTFWAGVLGGTFLTMASHGTDQLMVQRMLAARSLRESRLALLSSGLVIFMQFTLFLLIGVGLFVFYGTHSETFTSPDRIFPSFIVHEMPHGIAGLLVAAILAAAMSNLSAALNSLASTTVIDFYVPIRTWRAGRSQSSSDPAPQREPNTTLISRAATVFWAVILFAIAVYSIQHGGKGHVVETGLSIASVAYGCLLGVFLLGTLTRYVTQWGAILGMATGLALNLWIWQAAFPKQLGPIMIPHIAFTWYVLIGSVATFIAGSLFSLVFRNKKSAIAAIILGLALNLTASAQDFTPIDTLMHDAIAQKKIPGGIVVIGHNNSIVFKKSYGNRALEPAVEPMTDNTIFDMASLTKVLVTSTAILQLAEQHKLELDAPVASYLSAFAQNGKEKITIRQLLTHYSGLPEDVDLKDPWGLTSPDKPEALRRAFAAIPYGPPGGTFKYSDINFITLGTLVETASGEDLDVYALHHIFQPLHMLDSRYLPYSKTCGFVSSPLGLAHFFDAAATSLPRSCNDASWSGKLIPNTAPTAHDDQGSPATNPNFDQLLRGTVHDPTTRRMGGVAGHAGIFSTAHDTALFAQAMLDKLLRNSGPFPLTQASLRAATSPQEPPAAAANATIFTLAGETTKGIASRGLGWDLNSPFSRPRGTVFPIATRTATGSFGHTGFTGTSLWIDPVSNTYVILLTNAIHPRGAPPISTLRGQIATAAAQALAASASKTLTGIDVLEQTHFAALAAAATRHGGHLRLALLSNVASQNGSGHRTADILLHALSNVTLTTLFTPEHGLFAAQDTEHLAAETDLATHLPVISLYGNGAASRRPSPALFSSIDAVVIDLQDLGTRFWTFETLLGYLLEATAGTQTEIIVLDRPNPLGGLATQGPTSQAPFNYTNYAAIPLRHGLTFAELAQYFNGTLETKARLTVVPMQHWQRTQFFAQTGLAFPAPSPNMRSAAAAILYPAIGLTEQTNLSVGRGTDTPFENLGAPWINATDLAAYLTARNIPGVRISPTTLTVAETAEKYPSHGQTIPGIHFEVTDASTLDSPELGLELLAALNRLYPATFQLKRCANLLASPPTLAALAAGQDPRTIAATWPSALADFRTRTQPLLLYK